MSWLEENLQWVLLAVLLLALGLVVWLVIANDTEQCERTGMHDVCQDWANVNGVFYCLRWEKEACDP